MHDLWLGGSTEVAADISTSKVIFYSVKKGVGFCDNTTYNKETNHKWLNVGTQGERDKNACLWIYFLFQKIIAWY